jgi:ribonuclease BN (tRNA processing enzyme)
MITFLIDCGEGTQRQILQSGLGFKRLNRVLITHGHLDHILGLAGLLSTFMRWETIDKLEIYSGQWALDRIYDLIYGIVLRGAKPPMDLQLLQIKAGTILDENDSQSQPSPSGQVQQLAIPNFFQPGGTEAERENNRGRHYRTSQSTPPHLINTSNQPVALRP